MEEVENPVILRIVTVDNQEFLFAGIFTDCIYDAPYAAASPSRL
jgi:hypothetical protein